MALIHSRYGRAPAKSCFLGYSKGGGEAPAAAPGWNVTAVALGMFDVTQAVAVPGAWLNEAERHTLHAAVMRTCGPARVDSFVRYYEVPGAQHGPSSTFQPERDQPATIEDWVEKGTDPANDVDDAESFTCASR
ncbi:tannase/feruloyl esterase family alpha/beta hydrolase [Saccharothrix sp. Mg75]|uniref:tannase/feruloyl esterase family alpha/beta hydrolase n=1 Tax=Saccharothrix sp. Mg75 TaxID=3445357 RepID=UPI003EE8A51E